MNLICYSCKNNTVEVEYKNLEYYSEYGQDIFQEKKLRLCKRCGFSYAWPFIPREKLDYFYEHEFLKRRKKYYSQSYYKFKPNIDMLYRLIKLVSQSKLNTNKPVYLDFGGGAGGSCENFRYMFPDAKIFCDDSNCYLPILKRKNIIQKSLGQFNENSIDLIFSSHTFEHFNAEDIQPILKKITSKLKSNGSIFIEVPHDNNIKYEKTYIYNGGPHLVYYSKKSLVNFLENVGLKIISAQTVGNKSELSGPTTYENSVEYIEVRSLKKTVSKIKNFITNYIKSYLNIAEEGNFYNKMTLENDEGEFIQIIASKIL